MMNMNFQAKLSCLPFVSPFVGLYNNIELLKELAAVQKEQADIKASHASQSAFLPLSVAVNPLKAKQDAQSLQKRAEESNGRLPELYKKGRMYSIASAIGGLSTLIATVALVALGVLTGPSVTVYIGFSAFKALHSSYRAYCYHDLLQKHNAPLEQRPATA